MEVTYLTASDDPKVFDKIVTIQFTLDLDDQHVVMWTAQDPNNIIPDKRTAHDISELETKSKKLASYLLNYVGIFSQSKEQDQFITKIKANRLTREQEQLEYWTTMNAENVKLRKENEQLRSAIVSKN